MRVRMRLRLFHVLARASENASSKIQQKLKKSKNPPNVDWSDDGWSYGWPVRVDSKKQKWKKTNYKIMERITLAWGKHKNGKNQLQKADKHGKNWKTKKMPLRT
jgi:hypothetical protein